MADPDKKKTARELQIEAETFAVEAKASRTLAEDSSRQVKALVLLIEKERADRRADDEMRLEMERQYYAALNSDRK